jgi:3-oxoacyl-[acyl-carrier-protein] synthase II
MASGNNSRRVVITGVGLVTALGNSTNDTWSGILAGKSGAANITAFDASAYPTRFGAEVRNFEPSEHMDLKDSKRTDRTVHLAMCAARQAMAGVDVSRLDADRIGVVIGSGIGGIYTFERQHSILIERGPDKVSPFFIPMMIADMPSGYVSIAFGLKGPNYATVSACASGGNALADAFMLIRLGYADAVLTGGTEAAISPIALAGFSNLRALSRRNDAPEKASRPFDAERDGFVIGEGAGILFVEELEHAKKRGATILAELIGVGMTGDAYHQTSPAPDGEGAVRAMQMAIDDAGLKPEQVEYINAHGTSTELNDASETAAIKRVFGDHARKLMVSSTKSMIGHLLGAAAGVEAIFCVLAIQHGMIPPTINYEHPDPQCDLDYVPNQARAKRIDVALSNTFGFGGHNASMIVRRYTDS